MGTQFETLHKQAMDMVSKAIIQKNEDPKTYQKLMKQAFEIESEAAYMLYGETDIEPARSILFQSAANIASEIEMYDEAIKMVYAALSGTPPMHISKNLNDLCESIQFSRHLRCSSGAGTGGQAEGRDVKHIPITVFAIIDDDTVHCDNKCELRSYRGNGYEWEHYCSVFDLDLEYDRHAKKWWRCLNCIANEKAQEEK